MKAPFLLVHECMHMDKMDFCLLARYIELLNDARDL